MTVTLVLIGSGSLARATAQALSTVDSSTGPLEVVVYARNAAAAADLCHGARVRAALCRRAVRFSAVPLDITDTEAMAEAFAAAEPDGVLVCASTQSPWEHADRPSAWTALLRRAGFGLTLPFQAQVPLAAGRAVRRSCPSAFLVNACFPDAVNPLLATADVAVLAGVGNVGLLAAALQAALGLPDQSRLHVLAHHLHLHAPAEASDEAQVWLDGTPLTDLAARLAAQRASDRRGLNAVTGLLAAQLVTDLLGDATRDTHLPGVAGRPGGYPVRVAAGTVALRLPPGVDEDRAVRANQQWARREGVLVDGDRVCFGPTVGRELAPVRPDLAEGFAVAELDQVTAALSALRERLRGQSHHRG